MDPLTPYRDLSPVEIKQMQTLCDRLLDRMEDDTRFGDEVEQVWEIRLRCELLGWVFFDDVVLLYRLATKHLSTDDL